MNQLLILYRKPTKVSNDRIHGCINTRKKIERRTPLFNLNECLYQRYLVVLDLTENLINVDELTVGDESILTLDPSLDIQFGLAEETRFLNRWPNAVVDYSVTSDFSKCLFYKMLPLSVEKTVFYEET